LVYEALGDFNIEFSICGDYDFIFRAYHSLIVKFVFTDKVVTYYRMGGISTKIKTLLLKCLEGFVIRKGKLPLIINIAIFLDVLARFGIKVFLNGLWKGKILARYYNLRYNSNLKLGFYYVKFASFCNNTDKK
jgi:hypothetical protein